MPYFRKKPVVIEARKYDGANARELQEWAKDKIGDAKFLGLDKAVKVRTLEGVVWAREGDWIIRGVKGEFYPCKPDIFEATYEEVSGIHADEPT